MNYHINVIEGHTTVNIKIAGRWFAAFACSCGAMSEDFPSFRPENKCVVCADDAVCNVHALDDFGLCKSCNLDFAYWIEANPELPVYDFLYEKLQEKSNG